jgi:hypothetical protein
VSLGVQGVVHKGEGAQPAIALSYSRRVYNGGTPDLDFGSSRNSMLLLASADVKGFHFDTNYLFNEVIDSAIHRAQFGQTLSAFHSAFSPERCRRQLVGPELQRAEKPGARWWFQSWTHEQSTRWEVFAGFTYLLPYKVLLH